MRVGMASAPYRVTLLLLLPNDKKRRGLYALQVIRWLGCRNKCSALLERNMNH
jgi:hypothetical protein